MALKTGNALLDALGGTPWPNTHVVTFMFDQDTTKDHSTGGAWTTKEQNAFWDAIRTWSAVADIRFLQVDNAAAADMIERKVTTTELPPTTDGSDVNGRHDAPGDATHIGQFNTVGVNWSDASLQRGGARFGTIVHEIGHAIGMAHPHDDGQGTGTFPAPPSGFASLDARINTIMSYNGRAATVDWGHIATPMALDIAAIQLLYGAVQNNVGDTVYTLTDGEGPGTFYSCIWDTGGFDTIQYDGVGNATIDLRHAWLGNGDGGGGFLSSVDMLQLDGSFKRIDGGFTIAGDITGAIADVNGDWGVIIEQAIGGWGNDRLFGNAADNTLRGGAGNDHMNGWGGNDTMMGGTGNDDYVVDQSGDQVFDDPTAGGGTDDRIFTSLNTYNISLANKGLHVEHLQYVGKDNFVGTGNALNNTIVGADGNDTLRGGVGNDTLVGGKGNDTLEGGANNDILYGDAGSDIMRGGGGDDIYFVDTGLDVVVESQGALRQVDTIFGKVMMYDGGVDTVVSLANTLALTGAYVENLTYGGTASFTGSGNNIANVITGGANGDKLKGFGGDDTLIGGDGADILDGGLGNDTLIGGARSDTFVYSGNVVATLGQDTIYGGDGVADNSDDTLDFSALNGRVVVDLGKSSFQMISGAITVNSGAVTGIEKVIGTVQGDTLIGSGGTDWLSGGGGNDILNGGAGIDILEGGAGTDLFTFSDLWEGALVNDFRSGEDMFDLRLVSGLSAFDQLTISQDEQGAAVVFGDRKLLASGIDATTLTSADFLFFGQPDPLTPINGTEGNDRLIGNAFVNVIDGKGGDDVIDGRGAADTLIGGAGNDRFLITGDYPVSGIDKIDGGADTDTLDARDFKGRMTVNLTNGTFALTSADGLQTLTMANRVTGVEWAYGGAGADNITGTNADNQLSGGESNDVLNGLGGNDILHGGAGSDNLQGGAGNDLFFADTFDTINGGAGYDTIHADESTIASGYAFKAAGTAIEYVHGNSGNDSLDATGLTTAITLAGSLGDDTLIGGSGADRLDAGDGNDTAKGAAGNDYITGGAGDDHLEGGAGNDYLGGDGGRNTLYGDGGNDTLVGGDLFDWMEGGAGNDVITGTGGQTVQFGGDGNDTMTGSLNATNYFAGGLGNDVMRGGNTTDYVSDVDGGNDWLYGGAGDDSVLDYYGVDHLFGEDGNDFVTSTGSGSYLDGGAGNDYLSVANGDYTVLGGSGNDTLEASGHGKVSFTGGADADVFTYRLFGNGPLSYTVTDFEDGVDKILLWDHKYYGDINPNIGFDSLTIADSAAGAVVSWNGTSQMTLVGMMAGQITAADFLLA